MRFVSAPEGRPPRWRSSRQTRSTAVRQEILPMQPLGTPVLPPDAADEATPAA